MKKFEVDIQKVYEPIVERARDSNDIERLNESIFAAEYANAFQELREIVAYSKNKMGSSTHCRSTHEDQENYNNIIAFVGDRGVGKTTALRSFVQILKDGADEAGGKLISIQESTNFIETPMIDPSLFDEKSNIIEIVIGTLFSAFRDKLDKNDDGGCSEGDRIDLLEKFNEVHEILRTMTKPKEKLMEGDAIDSLLKISNTARLKQYMHELIQQYLKVFTKSSDSCLIIQIDDIDVHTEHAYEMAEQIRKYLMLDRVVVLMALKVEQLEQVVLKHYCGAFEKMLKEKAITLTELKGIRDRYMEKLIPEGRRIFLPTVGDIFDNTPVCIVDSGIKYWRHNMDYFIKELIYVKTGTVAHESKHKRLQMTPKNLREFKHLVKLLWDMKTVHLSSYGRVLSILNHIGLIPRAYTDLMRHNQIPRYVANPFVYENNHLDTHEWNKDFTIESVESFMPLESILYIRTRKNKWMENDVIEVTKQLKGNCPNEEVISRKIKTLFTANGTKGTSHDDFEKLRNAARVHCKDEKEGNGQNIHEMKMTEERQISRLKSYFFSWCKENLAENHYPAVRELFQKSPTEKNAYMVRFIADEIGKRVMPKPDKDDVEVANEDTDEDAFDGKQYLEWDEFERVTRINNNPQNISIGDVLFAVESYEAIFKSIEADNFVFAVKMSYSMLLKELYYQDDNYEYRKSGEQNVKKTKYSQYDCLVGGAIYNPVNNRITKLKKSTLAFKHYRLINRGAAHSEYKDTLAWCLLQFFIRDVRPLQRVDDLSKSKRDGFALPEAYIERYRSLAGCHYDRIASNDAKYALFDLLSFLPNINSVDLFRIPDIKGEDDEGGKDEESMKDCIINAIRTDEFYFGNVFLHENLIQYDKLRSFKIEAMDDFLEEFIKALMRLQCDEKTIKRITMSDIHYLRILNESINGAEEMRNSENSKQLRQSFKKIVDMMESDPPKGLQKNAGLKPNDPEVQKRNAQEILKRVKDETVGQLITSLQKIQKLLGSSEAVSNQISALEVRKGARDKNVINESRSEVQKVIQDAIDSL